MNGISTREPATEVRELDVPRALSQLEKQCAAVEISVDNLLSRLECVTHAVPPSPGKVLNEGIRVTPATSMGERITTTTISLQRLEQTLQNLLHRLEV